MTGQSYGANWQTRRRHALKRARFRCQHPRCQLHYLRTLTDDEFAEELAELPRDAYRLEVHHLTYDRFGDEHPDDLVVLCPACHAAEHGRKYVPKPLSADISFHIINALLAFRRANKRLHRARANLGMPGHG